MHHNRPKNLNLMTIRFPLPAIASIIHRVSGFILFLMIPLALWLLAFSLTSEGYEQLLVWRGGFFAKFICWLLLTPFLYHLVAGIRHLLSDMHIGNTKAGGKRAAIFVFITFFLLILLAGVWIW